ncbi:UNVERIFIED_CONTAM: DDE-type integrase/transposase/recombinase, partial [Salmonella enterica subsp. enterica serovar Weltevreden]
PKGVGGVQYAVVAVDYFTGGIEAKPLAIITSRIIQKFVWENIMCRFGVPHVLISDNGTQFRDGSFQEFCVKHGIKQHFASVA